MSTPPDPVDRDPADPANRTRPSMNPAGAVTPSSRPSQWRKPAMVGAAILAILLVLILLF